MISNSLQQNLLWVDLKSIMISSHSIEIIKGGAAFLSKKTLWCAVLPIEQSRSINLYIPSESYYITREEKITRDDTTFFCYVHNDCRILCRTRIASRGKTKRLFSFHLILFLVSHKCCDVYRNGFESGSSLFPDGLFFCDQKLKWAREEEKV